MSIYEKSIQIRFYNGTLKIDEVFYGDGHAMLLAQKRAKDLKRHLDVKTVKIFDGIFDCRKDIVLKWTEHRIKVKYYEWHTDEGVFHNETWRVFVSELGTLCDRCDSYIDYRGWIHLSTAPMGKLEWNPKYDILIPEEGELERIGVSLLPAPKAQWLKW